ncbi:hypothetical protein D9756_009646 [Leucocoprinus leucothites]|uniref:Uncharacterized protein n=1 Tax=Leucocoprinus leucothites TaxID=201217 RepID=A0A8H5FTE5_9AGAR|nr:hypothetical protein D9756_009646 [Leucoagaricus leucothites]
MKVFAALLASLAAVVSAQNVMIGAPSNGAQLTAGESTVVQIKLPPSLTSVTQVSVVIGIAPCFSNFCPPPSDQMGNLLYSGPYDPQRDPNSGSIVIYQNFTVTIPSHIPEGPAVLGVAHFYLLGAALIPTLETQSVSVVIQ